MGGTSGVAQCCAGVAGKDTGDSRDTRYPRECGLIGVDAVETHNVGKGPGSTGRIRLAPT